MKAIVEIGIGVLTVEYEIKITEPSRKGHRPSLSGPGEPREPAQFEVEIIDVKEGISGNLSPSLEIPHWMAELLELHLRERDDVCEAADELDMERGDYDDAD